MKAPLLVKSTWAGKYLLPFIFLWFCGALSAVQAQLRPEEQLGELFREVQLKRVFADSKTFVDCIALFPPEQILQAYQSERLKPGFKLEEFVMRHFRLPPEPASGFRSDTSLSVSGHINRLWPVLTRQPNTENSSLIPLPHPYVVPGGRFREIYYWDSYFTMLGLQVSGRQDLIQHMVDNFTYLINTVGHIPNGNRSYYVSRSQPPFYALMLELLAQEKGEQVLLQYAPALRKEYAFWMDGAASLSAARPAHRRVVRLPGGQVLNRYWDDKPSPRPESYAEDVALARESGRDAQELYRHIKAAAESGWDFSTRWLADGKTLKSIHTTEIIPVDLNALLYRVEQTLARMARLEGKRQEEKHYLSLARDRSKALRKYCWNRQAGLFMDYDFVSGRQTGIVSAATVYPLYFCLARNRQARRVAEQVAAQLLRPGGLVTTPVHSGQQWDAPNGWAPLQWLAIQGLRHYKQHQLASQLAARWISLNEQVYKRTGKLVEKYNVDDLSLRAGGGEYPLQDGFGWTNGVLLRLLQEQERLSETKANRKLREKAGKIRKKKLTTSETF